MSRQLPPNPNLEFLRKQAKALLDGSRVQHPSWQLADAQHALARDFGFTSWPALKGHVDATVGTRAASATGAPPVDVTEANTSDGVSPLAGSWLANIAASTRHPALQFESATLEIRVAGDRVTMAQVVVDDAGRSSASTMTIVADGTPRQPDGGGARHLLTVRRLDSHSLEAIDSLDGAEVGRGVYHVEAGGRQLVVTTAAQRLVFERR